MKKLLSYRHGTAIHTDIKNSSAYTPEIKLQVKNSGTETLNNVSMRYRKFCG